MKKFAAISTTATAAILTLAALTMSGAVELANGYTGI